MCIYRGNRHLIQFQFTSVGSAFAVTTKKEETAVSPMHGIRIRLETGNHIKPFGLSETTKFSFFGSNSELSRKWGNVIGVKNFITGWLFARKAPTAA